MREDMRYLIIVLCAFTIGSVGVLSAATPQAHAAVGGKYEKGHKGGKKSKKGQGGSTTPPPK